MTDVALATCLELPEPDVDAAPLRTALSEKNISVEEAAWDDPTVDWARFRMIVLRATWNYHLHLAAFVSWAERVAGICALHNPVDVIRWNTHKRYLHDLAARGLDVVPTVLVDAGKAETLASVCRARGWIEIVCKPAVSGGSFETRAMSVDALNESWFARMCSERDMLVQPLIDSVRDYGERSIVVIDDVPTHSIRKAPRFGGDEEAITGPFPITDAERQLAHAALAEHPGLLYARVDMARDAQDRPMVMELELTEPSLFFDKGPTALTRIVDGIERRLQLLR